jgi:hypothetical protein
MKMRMWIAAALLVLPLVACNGLSANVQFRVDENYNYLTVNMSEEEAQVLFAGIFEQSNDLQLQSYNRSSPGEISVSGKYRAEMVRPCLKPERANVRQNGQLNVALTSKTRGMAGDTGYVGAHQQRHRCWNYGSDTEPRP